MPDHPTDPVYRFHGRRRPTLEARTPVLAQAEAPDVEDGVALMRLYDPIDSWGGEWGVSAKEFARALDTLPGETSEIRLHINSPGGEVYEGLAILNLLRNHKARVVAVVDGLAASAASFITAGADEVVMGRNTQLMIHDAWGLCVGASVDMRDMGDRLDKISDNIASVYAEKAGGSTADWRSHMLAETWYDAEEAVAAGLADRVDGDADPEASNRFDLSIFQHAGREDAPPPPIPACQCGLDGAPALEGGEHKIECPTAEPDAISVDTPTAPDDTPDAVSGDGRRHRFMQRRLSQRTPAA